MKKNALAILALLLLASALTLSTLPTAKAAQAVLDTHPQITVDGDPSDWTGTAPTVDNTLTISNSEFIWKDATGDDTGPGMWEYPTSFNTGEADLLELRICWNDSYLFVLFKLREMTVGQWNRTAIDLTISTNQTPGSGETNGWYAEADMKVNLTADWEYQLEIIPSTRIRVEDSSWATVADPTTDPALLIANSSTNKCFEVGIPIAVIGSPAGKIWDFTCIVGLQSMLGSAGSGHFAEIEETADANNPGGGVSGAWEDPDAFDAAFYNTTAEQEAAFSVFTAGGGDNAVVVVSAYLEIPEFPLLLPYGFAIMAAIILAASFTMRKKLNL